MRLCRRCSLFDMLVIMQLHFTIMVMVPMVVMMAMAMMMVAIMMVMMAMVMVAMVMVAMVMVAMVMVMMPTDLQTYPRSGVRPSPNGSP